MVSLMDLSNPVEFPPKVYIPKTGTQSPLRLVLIHPNCFLNLFGACRFQCLLGSVQAFGCYLDGSDYENGRNMTLFCIPIPMPPVKVSVVAIESNPLIGQEKLFKARLDSVGFDFEQVKYDARRGYCAAVLVAEPFSNISRLENIMGCDLFKPSSEFRPKKILPHCYSTDLPSALLEPADLEVFRDFCRKVKDKLRITKRVVAVVVGGKGTGKSTTAKLMVNLCRTKDPVPNSSVYFMDCDVGQSEFTPAGLISLHKINAPILSVPFGSQLKTFPRSYYFGSITPETNIELYKAMIKKVYQDFIQLSETEKHSLLVVNTLGWVENVGEEIQRFILDILTPVELLTLGENSVTRFANCAKIKPHVQESHNVVKSATIRDRTLTGYLAHCLVKSDNTQVSSFSEVSVRMVNFANISIFIHPTNLVADYCYLAALNMSTVALCSIPPEFADLYDNPRLCSRDDLPRKLWVKPTVSEDALLQPFLRCHGYGLVRAVSLEHKKIYLITPTDPEELRNVSILALGDGIPTPKSIFQTQTTINAPYLMQSIAGKCETFNKLSMPLKIISSAKKMGVRNRK